MIGHVTSLTTRRAPRRRPPPQTAAPRPATGSPAAHGAVFGTERIGLPAPPPHRALPGKGRPEPASAPASRWLPSRRGAGA